MKPKVIVLGLDGLEPSIVEAMIGCGALPHFQKLRERGFYSRLATTYPAQTPVAWASFATGTNPGGHGIFDFVRRDPATYQPDFALSRFEKPRNAFSRPKAINLRKGVPLWTLLTKAGTPSVVLRCPGTFPPDSIDGRMLAGVGVPDLRGSQGKGTFYTQDRSAEAHPDEHLVHLSAGSSIKTSVIGPGNSVCDLTISSATVTCGASTAGLALHAWSPWLRLKFRVSALQSITGLVRFYLVRTDPFLELYASPVNFDPEAPPFPISSPADYAGTLSRELGLFSTLGMAEDHAGFNNGRFDADAYWAQCMGVFEDRERMTLHELNRFSDGLLFVVFDTPDRVNHMFWAADRRRIEDCYECCDRLLGRVLEVVDDGTLLIVLSDHGCSDFRRAFHVNSWLRDQGLLAVESDAIHWARTRSYAFGFGGIYLNLSGREGQGIVGSGAEADRLIRTIREGLAGLRDPQTGETAIRSVLPREEIYGGPYAAEAPDLIVNFAPGFRASWQTALGGVPETGLFEDNLRRWSGDHLIDPDCVPGVLFMNRAGRANPAITDLAPTVLSHLGAPAYRAHEGTSLLE